MKLLLLLATIKAYEFEIDFVISPSIKILVYIFTQILTTCHLLETVQIHILWHLWQFDVDVAFIFPVFKCFLSVQILRKQVKFIPFFCGASKKLTSFYS